jgi:2-polyprenyl-6-methoxyphenol hydroxylase-like FAD-dependent oxidoreductase
VSYPFSRAVVLGGSMSGLLAARALSDHFERITVVERDRLPEGDVMRKGVPQAGLAHGLLASGYRVMDAYFSERACRAGSAVCGGASTPEREESPTFPGRLQPARISVTRRSRAGARPDTA